MTSNGIKDTVGVYHNGEIYYVTPTSLYGEYKANGGLETKKEFNDELFNLIG